LYLLTETAAGFWPRFGFERIGRDAAPAAVRGSAEWHGGCPASAVAMALDLTRSVAAG
jgi:amino-acid N-acetyltransferase